jgi:8-oxo-dGTP diphosphatase
MPNIAVKPLHVVAAVIRGADGKIFIAKRPAHISQGGKWEFPGGKVEAGESHEAALKRELQEEIGITITQASPLIQVRHQYVGQLVYLDVWEVTEFTGEAHGKEGQATQWVNATDLSKFDFPAANQSIITAAQLPKTYLITPEPTDKLLFLASLEQALQSGIQLVQFRAKSLTSDAYIALAYEVIELVQAYQAKVLLNSPPVWLAQADGLHLTSKPLTFIQQRPFYLQNKYLSAACHNLAELKQAERLGCDFMLLSPVQATASHTDSESLGWQPFQALIQQVNKPIYALGGLQTNDLVMARMQGAQGIAAIRGLWPKVI